MKKSNFLSVFFNKTDPKPNPKSYYFKTIEEIFEVATDENIDEIMKSLTSGIKMAMAMREVATAANKGEVKLNGLTWIDD